MSSPQEVITLNVGGVLYTTTRSTLTQFGDSMLGALFSGRYPVSSIDRDGNPFIDRDGPTFRHVLNFLRTGRLTLPGDFRDHDMLADEADFFQIEPLVEAIRSARDPPSSSDEEATSKSNDALGSASSMLEMYQVTCDFEPQTGGGYVHLSGPRSALLSLPLAQQRQQVSASRSEYQTVYIDENKKMEVIAHLQETGWQMVTSSFAAAFSPVIDKYDHARCYTTHKYIWCRPKPKPIS